MLETFTRLPGYEFTYRNRDEKRGGGVGIYIRDTIEFMIRNDISKLDESIEHLWVEIQGRKKNSACLIGVFYQPSSENTKKLEWIEKLDSVLSIVKSTYNGTVKITGDSNIGLLASTEILKRYIEVLESNPNCKETYIPYHFQHFSKQNSSFKCIAVSENQ